MLKAYGEKDLKHHTEFQAFFSSLPPSLPPFLKVSEIDFLDSILVLKFPEELNKELLQLYQENCKEIRAVLSEMSLNLPHYQDLEWRCDVELASRSLQRQAQPSVLLRLHTKQGGED